MPSPTQLKTGAVLYMLHRGVFSSVPHYCIVLNCRSEPESVILLSVITSQVEKRKKRNKAIKDDPRAIVEISPQEYSPLTKLSVVDCSSTIKTTRAQLEIDMQTAVRKQDIPEKILEKIILGILVSKIVPEADKSLLRE